MFAWKPVKIYSDIFIIFNTVISRKKIRFFINACYLCIKKKQRLVNCMQKSNLYSTGNWSMGRGFQLAKPSPLPTLMHVCIFLYTLLRFFSSYFFHRFIISDYNKLRYSRRSIRAKPYETFATVVSKSYLNAIIKLFFESCTKKWTATCTICVTRFFHYVLLRSLWENRYFYNPLHNI